MNNDDSKWDVLFSYNKRAVWYRKRPSENRGNYIYTVRDDFRRAELVGHYIERVDKNYGEEEYVPMDVNGRFVGDIFLSAAISMFLQKRYI